MAIAAASSFSLEGTCCSTSYGITSSWNKSTFDVKRAFDFSRQSCRNSFFGVKELNWLCKGHDLCVSKVSVAADYSDSVPDYSYMNNEGYHPLEDLKVCKKILDTKLTSAEIARTVVEANSKALLLFPGTVHSEPHEQVSWAEYEYVIDDYGDLYFELFDDVNILEDHGASNPVNALIGMDKLTYETKRIVGHYKLSEKESFDDIPFDDEYFEVLEADNFDIPGDWVPNAPNLVHPIYFAKCLNEAVNIEYEKKMNQPFNGLSIVGCLRPTFADEEAYIRRLFLCEDSGGYGSDWKDGDALRFESKRGQTKPKSTLYRLEIVRIELFSVYGVQSEISLQDYQDAEPDILVHSTPAIVERFREKGIRCNVALKALCKRKGLHVEGAILIGVDSLGMDVRVFCGAELRTYRFPFKIRATSEISAEKQIQQLLFPRSRRKKLRSQGDGFRDSIS